MSKTIEQELKPCPFCGHKPYLSGPKDDPLHFVECPNCFSHSGSYATRELAIKNWNTRKPPVVEAGEGVEETEWPEKRILEKGSQYLQYDKGYNHCHGEFTEILKQKGLL